MAPFLGAVGFVASSCIFLRVGLGLELYREENGIHTDIFSFQFSFHLHLSLGCEVVYIWNISVRSSKYFLVIAHISSLKGLSRQRNHTQPQVSPEEELWAAGWTRGQALLASCPGVAQNTALGYSQKHELGTRKLWCAQLAKTGVGSHGHPLTGQNSHRHLPVALPIPWEFQVGAARRAVQGAEGYIKCSIGEFNAWW